MNTQYQLCFYSGSQAGKIFPITKEETKIGRDSSCDIVLTENSISRIHVFLYVQQNGSVVLVDNNSTNGTIVNNSQISAPVQLSENDVIGLGGDVMLVFQRVAGFDPGSQWNSTDIPAGNAPDSYNFEKKQGNPMNNENVNNANDGAANSFAPTNGQNQQPAADNFGFNQSYNTNYGMAGMNQGQQTPFGFNQVNPYGQLDMGGFNNNNQIPVQTPQMSTESQSAPFSGSVEQQNPVPGFQNNAVDKKQPASGFAEAVNQQQSFNAMNDNSFSQQQPMMDQSAQASYGANPYSQQMGQNSFGNSPYSQQMNQPNPMGFGNDPYSQQQPGMMGQQMPYGNDPYGQQQPGMMGQQMPYGNDPYGQQQPGMMGQQMPYGNDPYGQQPGMMGQQMPYGNDPYGQQQPGMMGQQMPYGNDPYGQQQPGMMGQQMPYGNDPYGQQPGMMGQQMPYGNNPYAQQPGMMGQQNPYGNNPYAQQYQEPKNKKTEDPEKAKKKKLFKTLGIILGVLLVIGIFIFIIDHNRLWCDVFPFLWDADTCANYVR